MYFLFTYAWILFLVVNVVNAFSLRNSSKTYWENNPELEEGYNSIFKAYLIAGSIPWLIMGLGILTGRAKSMSDFFHPRLLNPIVLVFHACIILIYLALARFIFLKNGAEFLEKHPGIVNSRNGSQDAKAIKRFMVLMLLGGVTALVFMWLMPIPVTK